MEAAADDLLAALSSPSSRAGLHSRFAAYLQPFSPHLPAANPNPKPPPKRATKQGKQQQPPPDAAALRSLAKRFLPFLCRALQLLPPLLLPNPSAGGDAAGLDELLEIYGLTLDCLAAISTCLAGKPYSVLLQRGRFVCCLESRGRYARAEAEAAATLDALRCALSPLTAAKPSRGAAIVAPLLPEPGIAGEAGADPEVTILAVELTVCLANCASKGKVKEDACYERVRNLVEQLRPWLRILTEGASKKYLTLLVNALSRCAIFLAAESSFFDADLVREFCVATLGECEKAQLIERLPIVARKICSSVDLSWGESTSLLLAVLESVLRVKAYLPKALNEFLEFIDYFSRSFLSNRDVNAGASKLFYGQGGFSSEISPPIASVLHLYATGLHFSRQQMESEDQPSMSVDFLKNEKNLQTLNNALGTLERIFFATDGKSSKHDNLGKYSSTLTDARHPNKKDSYSCSQSREHINFLAYLDSLEFVCKILLQPANAVWESFFKEKTVPTSGKMTCVLMALNQFIDSSLFAYSYTKMSDEEKERLNKTLLRALVSAIKISFVTKEAIQKSLYSINCAISSTWIKLEDFKYLIPSIGNIGVTLYNIGHFEEAPKALELCCQATWAQIRLSYCRLSTRTEGHIIIEDLPKDTLKDIITDAFARIDKMVNTLHRCGSKVIRDIVVKSLSELLAHGDTSDYHKSYSVLIESWVKITLKDFANDQNMDSAPLLYHSLMGYPSPLPKKLIGSILEQELLKYGEMESRATMLCGNMQIRIIDILLNELYCSKEYYLDRSKVLVRKAHALRSSGVQNISRCLESLSEAISLLRSILLDSSRGNAIVMHELAIAYCLHAHCAQEANRGGKVIFDDARSAVGLWSKMGTSQHSSPGVIFQQPSETLVPLLCSLVDLLAMKGHFELQFELCKLIIMMWKQENLPIEKLLSMLFINRRLNHACCHLPVDQNFFSYVAEHLGVDCRNTLFWRNCFKGDYPSLSMFLQQLWPVEFFSQPCEYSLGNQFGFNANVDGIVKVASSLVSEVPLNNQSAYLAGWLYYDSSERLLSRGQLLQAISYGREALQLRKKLLKKKFKFNLGKFVSKESECSGGQGFVSLEAWGPTMAEIWPDCTRPSSMRDSFLTPWNVLKCYLESILQVALMHELIGDGAEAEVLLRTGKEISCFQGLPIFAVVFTSALGQLYCKRQLWDAAEGELKHARDLLKENCEFISCETCRLTQEISVDVQAGDLFWNQFDKDLQKHSTCNLSRALGMYRSAMEKLNDTSLEFSAGSCCKLNTSCILGNKDCIAETKRGACNRGKKPLAAKDGVLPPCTPCLLFSQAPIDQYNELVGLKSERKNLKNAESAPPLDVNVKTSKTSSRLAKEQNAAAHSKTRTTRSSKRTAHVKSEKDLAELNSENDISGSDKLSTDALVCGKLSCSLDGVYCSRDDICNMFGCWNCLFVDSLNSESIENILQFRKDCIRRRHLVSLLLKTARALGAQGGKHGAHEVHSIYWQCISLLYFRSLPQGCYRTYEPHLIGLIMNENTGDFLSLERAEILCSMSFFLLKGFLSEQSRDSCCSFSSVQTADIVSWLLKAFVLSGESPSLLQEVCRLLTCIFLLSTIDSTVQLPLYSKGSLSLNHWAAYFHQASVGTHLNCHYLASLQALPRRTDSKGLVGDFANKIDEVPKFLRFSSADMEHLEKHVSEFFNQLPDVPIVCISMLGGDFVNVLGEALLLPSLFPAWMLLSRFDSTNKPTTMLLPVDSISKEAHNEDSSIKELDNPTRASDKNWKCPWSCTIIDYVAPTFRKLLEDNFRSLSGATDIPKDGQANAVRWWSDRMKLNNDLNEILENMEKLWLGPWKYLLLGHQSADQHSEAVLENLITGLESEFKLEANPALIKVILGGVASVDELKECVSQLVSYKAYFGRGGCCGRDRLRAFSCQIDAEALVSLEHLCNGVVNELAEPVERTPVILVLDTDVQMLPWENLPVLRNQEMYRMPSVRSIFLALTRSTNHQKDASVIDPPFPVIDPFNAFYLLNPGGDLISTQEEFDQLFRNYEWKGNAGDAPTAEELVLALRNHDLFLYFGHGSGSQYVSGKEIEKLDNCAAALLMGCSSGTLHCKGAYAPQGAPLSYLFAGSPSVIANLWDVSDKDIDRFSKALLNSWLQENVTAAKNCSKCCPLTQEFESMTIAAKDNVRSRRKGSQARKQQQTVEMGGSSSCCNCGHRRIASHISEARRACRLPLMIGASPVCYGVPTIIRKK
ncbi:separase-like isoform X2 [Triticum dicoccoides]|uniref:separase-like isoform X2 n=1 Tax=Triticum dicoccoides TaxID=85692 RepID=UPI001891B4CB|nr:separase-like isoform X2 [Triticum dicoccoides]